MITLRRIELPLLIIALGLVCFGVPDSQPYGLKDFAALTAIWWLLINHPEPERGAK